MKFFKNIKNMENPIYKSDYPENAVQETNRYKYDKG